MDRLSQEETSVEFTTEFSLPVKDESGRDKDRTLRVLMGNLTIQRSKPETRGITKGGVRDVNRTAQHAWEVLKSPELFADLPKAVLRDSEGNVYDRNAGAKVIDGDTIEVGHNYLNLYASSLKDLERDLSLRRLSGNPGSPALTTSIYQEQLQEYSDAVEAQQAGMSAE